MVFWTADPRDSAKSSIIRPVKIRPPIRHLVFALLLLVAQQLGLAHVYSHHLFASPIASSQDSSLPSDSPCDECLVIASLGAPLGAGKTAFFDSALAHLTTLSRYTELHLPAPKQAFESRAPPAGIRTI
jgi:hypothetical protein